MGNDIQLLIKNMEERLDAYYNPMKSDILEYYDKEDYLSPKYEIHFKTRSLGSVGAQSRLDPAPVWTGEGSDFKKDEKSIEEKRNKILLSPSENSKYKKIGIPNWIDLNSDAYIINTPNNKVFYFKKSQDYDTVYGLIFDFNTNRIKKRLLKGYRNTKIKIIGQLLISYGQDAGITIYDINNLKKIRSIHGIYMGGGDNTLLISSFGKLGFHGYIIDGFTMKEICKIPQSAYEKIIFNSDTIIKRISPDQKIYQLFVYYSNNFIPRNLTNIISSYI